MGEAAIAAKDLLRLPNAKLFFIQSENIGLPASREAFSLIPTFIVYLYYNQ